MMSDVWLYILNSWAAANCLFFGQDCFVFNFVLLIFFFSKQKIPLVSFVPFWYYNFFLKHDTAYTFPTFLTCSSQGHFLTPNTNWRFKLQCTICMIYALSILFLHLIWLSNSKIQTWFKFRYHPTYYICLYIYIYIIIVLCIRFFMHSFLRFI